MSYPVSYRAGVAHDAPPVQTPRVGHKRPKALVPDFSDQNMVTLVVPDLTISNPWRAGPGQI